MEVPTREATTMRSPHTATKSSSRSPQLERKLVHSNKDPMQPKKKKNLMGFPGGAVVKNTPANAGDTSLNPGLGRAHIPWRS